MRIRWFRVLAVLLVIVLTPVAWRVLARTCERRFLSTGPNGATTPLTFGVPYERITIASGGRRLDGCLVEAPRDCRSRSALLIFHGAGETVSDWAKAQRVLRDRCIASEVFDYSGHGDSEGPGSVANLNQDALAAYGMFARRFNDGRTTAVLGFSLGNAPMLDAVARFQPAPARVIIVSAFTSLRDTAVRQGVPRIVASLIPDVWNNTVGVSRVRSPLLVVHSDADPANPLEWGRRIFDAAAPPKSFLVVHTPHNAPYRLATESWWDPVIRFIEAEPDRTRSASGQ